MEALQLFHDLLSSHDTDWRIGSVPGRLPNINRGWEAAYQQLVNDYFSGANSTYPDAKFQRRFWMRQELFKRIVEQLGAEDKYFKQRLDALGKMGAATCQKVTAAMWLLAYGGCADQLNEWIWLSKSTIQDCLKWFVNAIQHLFGEEYLQAPTQEDVMRLLNDNA